MRDPQTHTSTKLSRLWSMASAVVAAAVVILGCGMESSVQPPVPDGFDDGHFIRSVETAGRGMAITRRGREAEDDTGGLLTEVTRVVSPSKSAELVNGRFTMRVPEGALDHVEEFRLSVDPSVSEVVCTLEPHATVFNAPVEVRFDLNGTDAYRYEDVRAQWFDEETKTWRDVESVWDPETQILIGYYEHFCSGRAGW